MPSWATERPLLEPGFEELYEEAPCGYLSLLPDGTVGRVNRTLLRSLGQPAEAVVGRSFERLLAPASRIYRASHWGPKLELEGEVREVPVELVRADGSRLSVLLNATLTRDAAGRLAEVRASLFDATDRRRYERQLVARAEQQAAVSALGARALEGAPLPALTAEAVAALSAHVDAERVLYVESGDDAPALRVGGETIRAPVGQPERPYGELVLHAAADAFGSGDRSFVESVAHVLAIAIERRRSDEDARRRLLYDNLTGLPNRALLHERIVEAVAAAAVDGSRFALCVLGLDFFKLINNTRGHQAGDELLRAVGTRLSEGLAERDMIARLGGDEFAVLATGHGRDGALLARRVELALRAPFTIEATEHVVGASAGVVCGDADSDPDDLLRDADVAMHRAKDAGRGRYVHFDQSMRERSKERVRIELELRAALQNRELRVHYQPVVCAWTGRVTSTEALVRWHHPVRGLVPPAAFVPVAEDSGLVVELGRYVLEEACHQLADWRAAGAVGPEATVAVNVSARQLARPDFPAQVQRALEAAGLAGDPSALSLEITETIMMSDESHEDVLAALAGLGVGLSLDDFGTGASALARLKRFPVDTLKIDRSFVSGLGGDGADEAIVAAVIGLAAALGLTVVAEGVETLDQLAALRRMGCERIQGYLFSKPLDPAALLELLVRGPLAPGAVDEPRVASLALTSASTSPQSRIESLLL